MLSRAEPRQLTPSLLQAPKACSHAAHAPLAVGRLASPQSSWLSHLAGGAAPKSRRHTRWACNSTREDMCFLDAPAPLAAYTWRAFQMS
jgi:hypothetical protein